MSDGVKLSPFPIRKNKHGDKVFLNTQTGEVAKEVKKAPTRKTTQVFSANVAVGFEKNPFAAIEDKVEPEIPTATLQVYQFIGETLHRLPDSHINRASSATLCHKRRWYQGRGIQGTPLSPRKMVNFLLGDLAEKTMQYFVLNGCVGPGKLYSEVDFGTVTGTIEHQGKSIQLYRQEDLTADIGGILVTAHADGWGKRNVDGQWELIEFKSSANWGFDDFKKSGPKDYLKQAHVNMLTDKAKKLGARCVRFFYLRKETGHMWDRLFHFDLSLAHDVAEEYKLAISDTEPKRPHQLKEEMMRGKATGRLIAGFPCTYCPYLQLCQGEYELDWKTDQFGFQSPIYVFERNK